MDVLREMNDDDLKDLGVNETIYRRRLLDAVVTKVIFDKLLNFRKKRQRLEKQELICNVKVKTFYLHHE